MQFYVTEHPIGLAIVVSDIYLEQLALKPGDTLMATVEADGALNLRPSHFDRKAFAEELARFRSTMKMGSPVVEEMRDDARY